MSTYDDEMYKYLTDSRNYKSARQISDLIPWVEDRLRKEFWELFENRLKESEMGLLKAEHTNLNFRLIADGWRDTAIGIDKKDLDIGICLEKAKFNMDEVRTLAMQNEETIRNLDKPNEWWLCWRQLNNSNIYRFNSSEAIIKILPENRDYLIAELADEYISYAKNLQQFCSNIQKFHL